MFSFYAGLECIERQLNTVRIDRHFSRFSGFDWDHKKDISVENSK